MAKHHKKKQKTVLISVCIMFALLGAATLVLTPAATAVLNLEPENGTVIAPALSQSDTSASGGRTVVFKNVSNPTVPVKLMPLGDSITEGHTVPGGYRIALWQRLVQTDKLNIDFVGSMANGPSTLTDKNHEGHGGWCIAGPCYGNANDTAGNLQPHIATWMNTYKPDIILLHIGTNDLGTNSGAATATTRLDTLINTIFTNRPTATLILAKLVPMGPAWQPHTDYNNSMPALVSKYQSRGNKIKLADMSTALNTSTDYLPGDAWHPNLQGYNKMADVWYPFVVDAYKGM